MRDFWLYNAKDSAVCIEAMPKIKADLERLGNLETYEVQTKMIEPLIYMSQRGMRVNVEARDKEAKESDVKIKELEARSTTLVPSNYANSSTTLEDKSRTLTERLVRQQLTMMLSNDLVEKVLKKLNSSNKYEAWLNANRLTSRCNLTMTIESDPLSIRLELTPCALVQVKLSLTPEVILRTFHMT